MTARPAWYLAIAALVATVTGAPAGCARSGPAPGAVAPSLANAPTTGATATATPPAGRMFSGKVDGGIRFTVEIGDPVTGTAALRSPYPHPGACPYRAGADLLVPVHFAEEAFTNDANAGLSVTFGVHVAGPKSLLVETTTGSTKTPTCLRPVPGANGVDLRLSYARPLSTVAIYENSSVIIVRNAGHDPGAYLPVLRRTRIIPLTMAATVGLRAFALTDCTPYPCAAGIGLAG